MKHGKKYTDSKKLIDPLKYYEAAEAIELVKQTGKAKFDETVELSIRLGVDPRHADQQVRGAVVLPHGTGKTVRVLVFAKGPKAEEAKAAGADFVGDMDMVQKIQQENWFGFDVCVATPDMMGVVGTWSPDGHASAPTAVSMLHAGVLMKLGGYGCFRVAMYLMPEGAAMWGDVFLILTTISVVYGAFSAVVQTDLKYINAYSSVSHCGLVLFALLMMTRTSCTGAILQMLSHGLMTALFFALIGMIYGRTHTRDVRLMGGLMKIMPFLAVGYVIAGLANLGLPGLSGFVAEMTIFVGSFQNDDTFHRVCTLVATTSIVITAVYILRVVGKILYGKVVNPEHLKLTDATWDERVAVICLIACVAGLGLAPFWMSDLISNSVEPIISQLLN